MEAKLTGKAQVIWLDVFSSVGRQAAVRYEVRAIPTVLILDNSGQVIHRQVGIPRAEQLLAQIEAALAAK